MKDLAGLLLMVALSAPCLALLSWTYVEIDLCRTPNAQNCTSPWRWLGQILRPAS